MNGQISRIHAQAERSGVKLAKFYPSAGRLLKLRDHSAPNSLLERISCDVPAEHGERKQAETAEKQEEISQDSTAHGRSRRLAQRFPSPALDSGGRM